MKVFMINSVCGIRSTGRICADIARLLSQRGHDCRIAYGREHVPEEYARYALRVGSEPGVRLHGIHARIFDSAGFCSRAATKKLVEKIREYDPDVIHLHNIHGYYLDVETLFYYLKEAGKPVVWTLHDCWSFTGHCAYFSAVGCDKWKTGCGSCPAKRQYPASLLLDRSRSNYERKRAAFTGVKNMVLVSPSDWLAELTRESFLKEYPVRVIRNGIDPQVFRPTPGDFRQRHQLQDKTIVMGAASVWDDRKGLPDLLALSRMLGEEYALVLVGLSQEQKKHLPGGIIGITRTESPQMLAELYTAADVFVNPTYEDNYPTVNLEAQACGTPVITYRTGGSVESAAPDCVVPRGDIAALAQKIRSGTARCRPELRFDRGAMLDRYETLYEELLDGAGTK